MNAEVGVVIPAYNAAEFIEQALDSVAAQTRLPACTTVVDDGSTDGTAAVVNAWMRAHPGLPVTFLENPSNRGLSFTRNRAITETPTGFIATLDADDLFLPNHLERLVEPLTCEPAVVLAFGDAQEFSTDGDLPQTFLTRVGSALWALESEDHERYGVLRGPVFRSLLRGNYVPVSGMAFRREVAIGVGLFDESLPRVEDRDFILRMARAGRFAFCHLVASRKRIHPGNISGPKHHLMMSEGAFNVLLRAKARAQDGSEEDRRAVDRELDRAAETVLYSASITSLSALSRVSRDLSSLGYSSLASQPRAWLRACWYSVSGKRGRG